MSGWRKGSTEDGAGRSRVKQGKSTASLTGRSKMQEAQEERRKEGGRRESRSQLRGWRQAGDGGQEVEAGSSQGRPSGGTYYVVCAYETPQ